MTEFLFFTQPIALILAAALPLLWLLFKLFPLKPNRILFPALVLFGKDKKDNPKPRDIPWWLKVIRICILLFFIMALGKPVYDQARQSLSFQPTLIIFDNSWSSAVGWDIRQEAVISRLNAFADISNVPIALLFTAPDAQTGEITFAQDLAPREAIEMVRASEPMPWPSDFEAARTAVNLFLFESQYNNWQVFWFGDGQPASEIRPLFNLVSDYGSVHYYEDNALNSGLAIASVTRLSDGIRISLLRRHAQTQEEIPLFLLGGGGDAIQRENVVFENGVFEKTVDLRLPEEIASQIFQISAGINATAAAVWHLKGGLAPMHIGIITGRDVTSKQDYLNDVFYIARAVQPQGRISTGAADTLVDDETISLIIWPDSTTAQEDAYNSLEGWVKEGGTLLRFAGPQILAENTPRLLPVAIYGGERTLGGAMSWDEPARIGGFDLHSPFLSLTPPENAVIRQQVLARPDIDLNQKRWIYLEDRTPLMTADKMGDGRVALFHTSADPLWSDIVLSDIFPLILKGVIDIAGGRDAEVSADVNLEPYQIVSAYGQIIPPNEIAGSTTFETLMTGQAGPRTPAGIYSVSGAENSNARIYYNLGQSLSVSQESDNNLYFFDAILSYQDRPYKNLTALFFMLALLFMIVDMFATRYLLQGAFHLPVFKKIFYVITIFAFCIGLYKPAIAQQLNSDELSQVLSGAQNEINFAYIVTGDDRLDQISARGLDALGRITKKRTTIEYGQVEGVRPGEDNLSLYPFIYWTISQSQEQLSDDARAALQTYMNNGGLLFIDTRDGQYKNTESTTGQERMRELTRNLNFGDMRQVDTDHVLLRSYYLIDRYPGAYDGMPVWVEVNRSHDYDGAPTVIVGAHDWVRAWSEISIQQSAFGHQADNRASELSIRFGINLVMMALTGNYKTDQVHIDYILERMNANE